MKRSEFLNQLEELLEMDRGTLKGNEQLHTLNGWDSLAVVGFIALMDRHFSMEASAPAVAAAKTVGDLVALAGPQVEQ